MSPQTHLKSTILAGLMSLAFATPVAFAQDPVLNDFAQFSTAAEASSVAVNYEPVDQLLGAFTDENRGRMDVAYAAIDDRVQGALDTYIDYLAIVPVTQLSREDQLAYWLNTRNVLIISAMAESRSRRRMSSDRGTFAEPGEMWTEKRITVEGAELSIDDIERGIVLANFSDNPNVIYGLYQGSQGGASLPMQAYEGTSVQADLKALGAGFVNSREGVKVRRSNAQVPAIYSWYSDYVFDSDLGAMKAHLIELAADDLAADILGAESIGVRKFSYKADELIIRQQVRGAVGFGGGGAGGVGGSGS